MPEEARQKGRPQGARNPAVPGDERADDGDAGRQPAEDQHPQPGVAGESPGIGAHRGGGDEKDRQREVQPPAHEHEAHGGRHGKQLDGERFGVEVRERSAGRRQCRDRKHQCQVHAEDDEDADEPSGGRRDGRFPIRRPRRWRAHSVSPMPRVRYHAPGANQGESQRNAGRSACVQESRGDCPAKEKAMRRWAVWLVAASVLLVILAKTFPYYVRPPN